MESIIIGGILVIAGLMLIVDYFMNKRQILKITSNLRRERITITVYLKNGLTIDIPMSRKERFWDVNMPVLGAYVQEYAEDYASDICKNGFRFGEEWIKPQDIEKITFSEVTSEPLNK